MEAPSSSPYVYENDHLMFSGLRERKLRFALVWKAWTKRCVRITPEGVLSYSQPKLAAADPLNAKCPAHKKFLLDKIEVSLMADEDMGQSDTVEYGLVVKCSTLDHIESYFRCIIADTELEALLAAMKAVSKSNNIDRIPRDVLKVKKKSQGFLIRRSKQSVMRRAVTRAMDRYDARSKKDCILAKRGAFKYLPVMMSNDLIHGSWWFTAGSVGVMLTCIVVLANKYTHSLDDDDSLLSTDAFVISWVLMLISGVFCTMGSLAFVRAFHENPPMMPLFTCYHLQSDELLASWLFFFSTVPFIPYVCVFLSAGYSGLMYLLALAFAIIAAMGCLLFVRACYPSDQTHRDLILPLSRYLCCCCSPATREYYFLNDWLGGSWFFYWGSCFVTFVSGIIFLVELAAQDTLQIWIMGTSFIECLMFLIGSAYFVAGSYPEAHEVKVNDGESEKPDVEQGALHQPHAKPFGLGMAKAGQYKPFNDEDDDLVVV